MKRENPGLELASVGAAMVAASVLVIGLSSASGCSNVIGLSKDYYEAEAGTSCSEALKPVGDKDYCVDQEKMIAVPGRYCIDLKEATWAEYEAVMAQNPAPHPGCQGNDMTPTKGRPTVQGDASTDEYPVAFVDWCDAWAYCNAKGKRLCGELGSGEARALEDSVESCSEDEWYSACSAGGRFSKAEGGGYSGRMCNVPGEGGEVLPTGSKSFCTSRDSAYLNIMDMNGNVAEWVNQCSFDKDTEAPISCKVRGGAFDLNLPGGEDCSAQHTLAAKTTNLGYVGIRCCADVKTAQ